MGTIHLCSLYLNFTSFTGTTTCENPGTYDNMIRKPGFLHIVRSSTFAEFCYQTKCINQTSFWSFKTSVPFLFISRIVYRFHKDFSWTWAIFYCHGVRLACKSSYSVQTVEATATHTKYIFSYDSRLSMTEAFWWLDDNSQLLFQRFDFA